MEYVVVIPARYQSSRLPGKPLIPIANVPMIRRTFDRCALAVPHDRIVVATDDTRILDYCREAGMQAVMTPDTCRTGTDRIAAIASEFPVDVYVNVQGDEPLAEPADILAVIEAARANPGEIVNGMCPLDDEDAFRSPTIPKVVARPDGRLLYMSRAAVPTGKDLGFRGGQRQVCIYAFPRPALDAFAATTAKTPLEDIEDIEILRFLELGFEVRMIPLSSQSIAVDTPEDVLRVEQALRDRGLI